MKRNLPKAIAITGTMGSGKSSVSAWLKHYMPVTDCDQINADLLKKGAPGYLALRKAGRIQLDESQELDKPAQAKALFSDPAYKQDVEAILHPMIAKAVQDWIAAQDGICAVEVPLLFESGMDKDFEEIWTVTCDLDVALKRLQEGRNISKENALERIEKQMPAFQKIAKSQAVLENNGTLAQLHQKIEELLKTRGFL